MLAALSALTASTGLDSRCARNASSERTRVVSILPGTTMLTVTPSRATSRARVFDQPTKQSRKLLDKARFGSGASTPEDVEVITLPQRRERIPLITRSVTAITDPTISWNCSAQTFVETPEAGPGGGPPVLLIRMSI